MKVLLIDCYIDDEGSRAFFAPLIDAALEVVRPPLQGMARGLDGVDAVVVSGSRASANDEDLWVGDTIRWLSAAVADDVPVLGVCFGHQLLAAAVGGTVLRRDAAEVGFLPVHVDRGDPLLEALPDPVVPFVSHGDEVVADGPFTVLGHSAACEVQALRVPGKRAWGTQFHLEYPPDEQERILRYRAETHPELGLDVEAELRRQRDTSPEGRALMARFLELAR
jgi:GMP synthase (glutamine-hydrolysing)